MLGTMSTPSPSDESSQPAAEPIANPSAAAPYEEATAPRKGENIDQYVDHRVTEQLADVLVPPPPPRRRVMLPVSLFLATCVMTFLAGCYGWMPLFAGQPLAGQESLAAVIVANWPTGLAYMAGVMGILFFHEMGHFLAALYYRVPASLPFFIPVPMMTVGTMGAVIGMEGSKANRKELFDIGIAGPLAGLVLAIPLLIYGIYVAEAVNVAELLVNRPYPVIFAAGNGSPIGWPVFTYGDPLFVTLFLNTIRPDLGPGDVLLNNPFYMAGWVGFFVTGLNMLPVSQLDGGHVAYAAVGRYSRPLARLFLIGVGLYIVIAAQYAWLLMFVLVVMLGVDHPRTADDTVHINWPRRVLGLVSLLIPILCFPPFPFRY